MNRRDVISAIAVAVLPIVGQPQQALVYLGVDGKYYRTPFDPIYDANKSKSFAGMTLQQRLKWCHDLDLGPYEIVSM